MRSPRRRVFVPGSKVVFSCVQSCCQSLSPSLQPGKTYIPYNLIMSSLASQLQNIASADASRLTSRTGAPAAKSYLFPPKTAASHDLDAIFSLAQSGYEELVDLDPDFEEFGDSLFSEHARRTDRTLLNQAENDELDKALNRCLRRLGRWVGVMAGGKCIEWLVRRFRSGLSQGKTYLTKLTICPEYTR